MSDFKSKLSKARQVHQDMTEIVSICKNNKSELDLWEIFWGSFYDMSGEFPFALDWTETGSSYEEDIMQRYNTIDKFIKALDV